MGKSFILIAAIPAASIFLAGCDSEGHSPLSGFKNRPWSSTANESTQSWHEGFSVEEVSPFGEEIALTPDQIHKLMNLWTWNVELTVPEDCMEISVYLDEYRRDQHVRALAKHGFTRMKNREDRGQPMSDTITLAIRFLDSENGRPKALRTAKHCLFYADATQWNDNGGFDYPRKIANPFFKKDSAMGEGLSPGTYVDRSMEWRARADEIDRIGAERRSEFQIGLFSAEDGTNLRVTFRMGARYEPPGRTEKGSFEET